MKKLLLLFCFSIFFLKSQAQTSVYHPFPDSSAVWCIYWGGSCGGPPDETIESTGITGDTIISGFVYKRLTTRYKYFHVNTCGGNDTTERVSLIRQDVSQKKVWIYDTFSKKESIFYDFNLQVGDTLDDSKVYWGQAGAFNPYIISSIDSVLINGDYRKRYNYHGGWVPNCFDSSMVEGIGSLSGLWHAPSDCFEYYSQLIVFQQDNKMLINTGSSFTSMCTSFYADIQDVIASNEWILSPNPATDKITISNHSFSGKERRVEIYNMMGEKVVSEIINNNSEIINVSSLAEGVYLVQVTDEEKIYHSKIIKQ